MLIVRFRWKQQRMPTSWTLTTKMKEGSKTCKMKTSSWSILETSWLTYFYLVKKKLTRKDKRWSEWSRRAYLKQSDKNSKSPRGNHLLTNHLTNLSPSLNLSTISSCTNLNPCHPSKWPNKYNHSANRSNKCKCNKLVESFQQRTKPLANWPKKINKIASSSLCKGMQIEGHLRCLCNWWIKERHHFPKVKRVPSPNQYSSKNWSIQTSLTLTSKSAVCLNLTFVTHLNWPNSSSRTRRDKACLATASSCTTRLVTQAKRMLNQTSRII